MITGHLVRLALVLNLLLVGLHLSSPASAGTGIACNTAISSVPTGPATVSTASTPRGTVLVVGSADYAGCSLYLLSSDQINSLTTGAEPFACSDNPNVLGTPCDTVLWPALLSNGPPIAGPGVNPTLLGTVTRTDVIPGMSVEQVTYAGLPLYRFFLDEAPGETEGANLFDPVTSPVGVWYLVEPNHGRPAPGKARLQVETAPVGGPGPAQSVVAVTMDEDFSVFPNTRFPVYSLSSEREHERGTGAGDGWGNGWGDEWARDLACSAICTAVPWPPVLTSSAPEAGPGVDPDALGTLVRPDGTLQVTYHGKPLHLFYEDAYISGVTGMPGIFGAGKVTPWGVFNTVRSSP